MGSAPDASLSRMQAVTWSASLIAAPPRQQHNLYVVAGPSTGENGNPVPAETSAAGCWRLSCNTSHPQAHLVKAWPYELMAPPGALPPTAGREEDGHAQYEDSLQALGLDSIPAIARQAWRRQLQVPGPLADRTQMDNESSQVKWEAQGPAEGTLGRPRLRSRYVGQRRMGNLLQKSVRPKRRDSVDKQYSWAEWRGSHPSLGRLWQKAHTRYTKLVEVRLADSPQPF
jgi:hypothetical protein